MGGLKSLARVEATLKNFDNIAKAETNEGTVKIRATANRLRAIPTIGKQEQIQAKGGPVVLVAPATALKTAIFAVREAVVNGHGLWTWQHIQAKVPEVNSVTSRSEVKQLKKKIEVAYKESLDIGKEVNKVLEQKNPEVDAPFKSTNFTEFQAELNSRGKLLAQEFSPSGKNWGIVATLAKIDDPFLFQDKAAVQTAIEARVKNHVDTFGKLPTRQKVMEMAVQQANTIKMAVDAIPVEDLDIVNLSMTDLSSSVIGFKDFPHPQMRAMVEKQAQELLRAGGDFQDAMNMILVRDDVMVPLYNELLQTKFDAIDAVPMAEGEDPRLKPSLKAKAMMPGTHFYDYLVNNLGGPKLRGEAVETYRRLLNINLRNQADKMSIVEIGKAAYLTAVRTQIASEGEHDAQSLAEMSAPLIPELKQQLAKHGEINWVGFSNQAGTKKILDDIKATIHQPLQDGMSADFVQDAHRSTFTYHIEGLEPFTNNHLVDKTQREEVAMAGLKAVVDHHPGAIASLSRIINQNGIALGPNTALGKAYLENPEEGFAEMRMSQEGDGGPEGKSQFLEYSVTQKGADKLEVSYNFFFKAEEFFTMGMRTYPVNRDSKLAGDVNTFNYGVHQKVTTEYDVKDLQNGIINPKLVGKPMIEMHLKPDWGKIAMQTQEQEFREKTMMYDNPKTNALRDLAFTLGNDYDKAIEIGAPRLNDWAVLNQLSPGRVSLSDTKSTLVDVPFSDAVKARLTNEIEQLSAATDAVGGTIDPDFGLPKQFLEDVERQQNQFQGFDGKMKVAENKGQTIAMLDRFAGNPNAAKALACACNQALIGTLMREHATTAIPGAIVGLGVKPENGNRSFQLTRLGNGNVGLRLENYQRLNSVNISQGADSKSFLQRSWPDGVQANPDLFDFKCVVDLELDQLNLLDGKLKVVNTPNYEYQFNLRPDWNNVV